MVGHSLVKRCLNVFARWALICSMISSTIMPSSLWAQQSSADFESPIIEHEVVQGGEVGGVEVFGATVVDNVDVDNVRLFYRFSGEMEYAELEMREVASSSYFSAKVDTANVPATTDGIEYYIQAKDTSGNIVLSGFAFQPLGRLFMTKPEAIAAEPAKTAPAAETSSNVNWVYIALGVLLVGGLVAANNQSSGSPPPERCTDACTVTLNIELP